MSRGNRKWTEYYMRERFPDKVRQQRIDQGLDPDTKPTHQWLRENGHRQFLRRARDLGYTPDEYLIKECGFEPRKKELPCQDPELKEKVERWLKDQDEIYERINGESVDDARCHLRRIMEIAEEYAGTGNLLQFGRGDRGVCANRARQLMRGLSEEFDNSGTRRNYVTTFRDFIQSMMNQDIIEFDPITPLVQQSGWTHERSRPQYLPSASLVEDYYRACETLTEQMVILSLAGLGLRPSDTDEENLDELLVLDSDTPHLAFSEDRKNGVGKVPIVTGLPLIEEYKNRLEADPEYDGALFPSDLSESGSRSTQWIRDTVARIGERTDATLDNGEKAKPKHFRQFWYSKLLKVRSEWLNRCNEVGKMQGTSSPQSVSTYAGDEPWFQTYQSYMSPIFDEAFPADIENTIADDLGNVDVEPKDTGQSVLDSFKDSSLASIGLQGLVATMIAVPADIIEHAVAAWVAAKQKALEIDPNKNYPLNRMPLQKKVVLFSSIPLVTVTTLYAHYQAGLLQSLLSGDPSVMAQYAGALIFWYYLAEKTLPTVDEAIQAAREQDCS